jgi:ribonucleoside-diphosphate reductase alpha chain
MELSSNALEIAERRYFHEGEDWEACCRRVGQAVAINENGGNWAEKFAENMYELSFLPGGRIIRNAGKLKQSVLNCAVLPIGDSIEEIGETIKNALILWSYGAGIGIDFSPLREEGRKLKSKGGRSSGMVSFLKAIDSVASTIETGGQRRSGCLAQCRVGHPEIKKFIEAKLKDKELSYFNLSVAINKDFLQKVEEDGDWELTFAGQVVEVVKAKELWYTILDSMIKSGDPGLINYDALVKNNSYYFQSISTTNLCGELPLPAFGACCLGSLVLPSFIGGKQTNWKKLETVIYNSVRFLDNVLDINYYPIAEMERVTKDSRRIGLGVMGLHDYLMLKQVRYGSDRSINEIEKLFRFIRDTAYRASIDLAQEKGAFPKYSKAQYNNASFIRKLPPRLRMLLKEKAIRNTTILSAPPTGTTSLIADTTSGLEPVFALAYMRKDRVSERIYIHPKMKEWLQSGIKRKPEWLVDTSDLSPEDHLDVQVAVQRYLDSAASKTINCPAKTTVKDLSALLLEYIRDTKGVTVYVEGSKEDAPLNRLSVKEARKYLEQAEESDECLSQGCRGGACDL